MCTQANMQIIDTVVKEFIDRGQAFTAFEVSLEAKRRGANERHRDMKNYIHQCPVLNDEMEFGEYGKTMVNVGQEGGQTLQAFLYHKKTFDPSTYKPLERKGGSHTQGPPDPALAPAVAASVQTGLAQAKAGNLTAGPDLDSDADDGTYAVDYRNRLMVPTKFLRDIQATPGNLVHVYTINDGVSNCIVMSKDAPNGVQTKTQMVERNGDLRLSQTTLSTSGLTGQKFVIETDSKCVKISAA